mgnify:CR=1 FL=1
MKAPNPLLRLLPPLLLLLAAGCSLDYSGTDLAEEMPEEVPDSVFSDYVFTSVRDGTPVYRIYAREARLYHGKHEAQLEGVFFREFADDGSVVTEGTAETAVVNTATDDVRLQGDLRFASSLYEAEIRAESLSWNSDQETLTSRPEQEVTILRENGTRIRGRGLKVHAPSRTIEFTGPVSGEYVYEGDGNERE